MNLGQELDFFMAQGPLFWAAAVSVGLGGTLLVSSVFVWMRRRILPAGSGLGLMRRKSKAAAANAPRIELTETGYSVEHAAGALPVQQTAATTDPAAERGQLLALLERLREVGDRLENALETPDTKDFRQPELKHSLVFDEIETRVGVG